MGHRRARRVPLLLAGLWWGVLSSGVGLGATACGEETLGPETYGLSGRVTVLLETGDEGGPVEGATVEFISDTLDRSETTTDSDGRYSMSVLSDVEFGQVRVSKDGFRTREETVYFDTTERRIDVQLRRQ